MRKLHEWMAAKNDKKRTIPLEMTAKEMIEKLSVVAFALLSRVEAR